MTDKPQTPTKERDAARLALCRAIIEQLTALNRSCAQAEALGIKIGFNLHGYGAKKTPEVESIGIISPSGNYKSIYKEVFK